MSTDGEWREKLTKDNDPWQLIILKFTLSILSLLMEVLEKFSSASYATYF